jgi:uncharacterized membrane protein YhaH (DUF805 family)
MNPFTGTLDRIGFLIWSLICLAIVFQLGLTIDMTKADHEGMYWLPYRIIIGSVGVVLSSLIIVRRLQNAGLSSWLAIIGLIPVFGTAFWVAMLFVPPKRAQS